MSFTETSIERENLGTLADPNRGRFAIVGLSEDCDWWLLTGMGGRSDASKNRYYQILDDMNGHGEYAKTAVNDMSLQQGDPAATLYIAQRHRNRWHVASNGEQTEGISFAMALGAGGSMMERTSFDSAQRLYLNEGKNNLYTSRISAAVAHYENYALMGRIVQKEDNPEDSDYKVYTIGGLQSKLTLQPGQAYIIYTYDGKGGAAPDYTDPRSIALPGSLDNAMDIIWEVWDEKTKAGLVGKEIKRASNSFTFALRSIHKDRAGYRNPS